ncbi:MAG: hypothetical protein RL065_13, partial [Bacteroidota bacterium]
MKKIILLIAFIFTTHFLFAQINKPLAAKLDSIYNDDQKYRLQIDSLINKFGLQSNQIHQLILLMNQTDSINLNKVKTILEKYGWLGADSIGK